MDKLKLEEFEYHIRVRPITMDDCDKLVAMQ